MRFPPFRGFGTSDAVKQLSQWINQPMLTQAFKDAASKLGIKEVPQLSSLQELLRQAGAWVESAVEPWTGSNASRWSAGINATGEWFSNRWTAPRLPAEVVSLSGLVQTSFTEDGGIEAQLKHAMIGATGAADVFVAPNLASALHLVSQALHRSGRVKEIVLPRVACIRVPSGAGMGGVHVHSILESSGTPIREIGTSTDCMASDYQRALSESQQLLLVTSPHTPQDECSAGIAQARNNNALVCELAMDGCIHDLDTLGIPSMALSRRWDEGADLVIVPGQCFLSGPECGIILGKLDAVAPIRALAELDGLQADRLTHLLLAEVVRSTLSREGWLKSPIGTALSTSLENLENRARRIAVQCAGTPGIDRVEVVTQDCGLGSGVWQSKRIASAVLKVFPSEGSPSRLADRLKKHEPPVWCNVLSGHVEIVLRTIDPADDHLVVQALRAPVQPAEDSPEAQTVAPE